MDEQRDLFHAAICQTFSVHYRYTLEQAISVMLRLEGLKLNNLHLCT